MLEFISVVQFHETEGSKTIAKYPSLQKEIEENLPAYVLPEGLHRFSQDSNMVLVRKPIFIKEFSEHPK